MVDHIIISDEYPDGFMKIAMMIKMTKMMIVMMMMVMMFDWWRLTNGWTKAGGGDKVEKEDADGQFYDGDEGGLDDRYKAQELDGHDHF